ncbi:MAG: translation elongation factor-like protein [Myxococcota bacterium]|nr:translation elongation factor-like protein [Myxococcota bacterium]
MKTPSVAEQEADRVGRVTHYWDHVSAAGVEIERGELQVGDTIHVRGHTTDYYQRIDTLQRNRTPVQRAGVGEEIAVHVSQRVRDGDSVYKIS